MTDLLSADRTKRRGYFQLQCVSRWVSEHLNGRANHSHQLWMLMVFELWYQQMLDRKPILEKDLTDPNI
jgi:asparagine synthase (glutamine-hydrolysing)